MKALFPSKGKGNDDDDNLEKFETGQHKSTYELRY